MTYVLVFGKNQSEHDQRLEAVLKWIKGANGTLNPPKCEFSKTKLTFLGHVIDTVVSELTWRKQVIIKNKSTYQHI